MSHRGRPVKRSPPNRATSHDGRKLRQLRLNAKLTIVTLSEKSGVSIGAISDLEHGRYSPRLSTAAALAKALDCDLNDFMADGIAA